MRDYIKVACVIAHNTPAYGGARFGAYFGTKEEAFAYWADLQSQDPAWEADLNDFRWVGINKAGFIAALNSAYATTFAWEHFVNGFDGFNFDPPGLDFFVETPRKQGFNSLTEKPRSRRR